MQKTDKTIISLELPAELKEKIAVDAKEQELSMSAFIRYLIKQYYYNREVSNGKSN